MTQAIHDKEIDSCLCGNEIIVKFCEIMKLTYRLISCLIGNAVCYKNDKIYEYFKNIVLKKLPFAKNGGKKLNTDRWYKEWRCLKLPEPLIQLTPLSRGPCLLKFICVEKGKCGCAGNTAA